MHELPFSLYTGQQVKALDALAMRCPTLTAYSLMCKAGEVAWEILKKRWPHVLSIGVICGVGNNAGDGFVLARKAKLAGLQVTVYQVAHPAERQFSEEAAKAREAWIQIGGVITPFQGSVLTEALLVDALLGTGTRPPLSPPFLQAIERINAASRPVLSLDIPSGLHPDTGASLGAVVKAAATITFVGVKVGLLCSDALEKVGVLYFHDLGVPQSVYQAIIPVASRLAYEQEKKSLFIRKRNAHKGDHGHVLIVGGGASRYSGAVCLAGEAALRAGAGLVSAVVAPESISRLARAPAELMCVGTADLAEWEPLLACAQVVLLGPGLAQNKWSESVFHAVLKSDKLKIVDADGLNLLARWPTKYDHWILTPHPKEASRLLNKPVEWICHNRFEAVLRLREKFGGIVILKEASTIVLDQENHYFVQPGGVPALATGGTGDVLAGLIAGLVAQRLPLAVATRVGLCVHLQAAKLEQSRGERGMLASDLFLHMRALFNPTCSL